MVIGKYSENLYYDLKYTLYCEIVILIFLADATLMILVY